MSVALYAAVYGRTNEGRPLGALASRPAFAACAASHPEVRLIVEHSTVDRSGLLVVERIDFLGDVAVPDVLFVDHFVVFHGFGRFTLLVQH